MRQYQTLIMIALMVVAFYFLIMRPQRKRQQAIQKTQSELGPGARVLLNSGIFGTILAVGPKQILIELSPGVELTVLKQAIARVATEADEDIFVDEDEDEDEEFDNLVDEPDLSEQNHSVEPLSPLDLPPVETPDDSYRPSSTYSASDPDSGSEPQRPSSN